jgi:threonine dehydrogenase-like Zn-dependent dehydrogenase
LQELVMVDTANVRATRLPAEQTALVEPVSIAVHAVARARVRSDEEVVVFGAGPIGFATAIAARDRGASVSMVDPVASRRDLVALAGFQAGPADAASLEDLRGECTPHVIIDTTGRPEVLQTALDLAGHGGRVAVVGLTSAAAPVCSGVLPIKELDLVGVSCCVADEFASAVELVRAYQAVLDLFVSHTFPLRRVREAFELLERDPETTFKALIDLRPDRGGTR